MGGGLVERMVFSTQACLSPPYISEQYEDFWTGAGVQSCVILVGKFMIKGI